MDSPFEPPLEEVGPVPVLASLDIDLGQKIVNNNFQITPKATRMSTQFQQQMDIQDVNNQVKGTSVSNLLIPRTNYGSGVKTTK